MLPLEQRIELRDGVAEPTSATKRESEVERGCRARDDRERLP